jgi:membrane protein required for beta-lactamase induction
MEAIEKLLLSVLFLLVSLILILLGLIFLLFSLLGFGLDILVFVVSAGNGKPNVGKAFVDTSSKIFSYITDISKKWFGNN